MCSSDLASVSDTEPLGGAPGPATWTVGLASGSGGASGNGSSAFTIQGVRSFEGTPGTDNGSQVSTPGWAANSTLATTSYPTSGGSTVAYGSQLGLEPFLLGGTNTSGANNFNTTADLNGWSTPHNVGQPPLYIASDAYYGSFMGPLDNDQGATTALTLNGYGAQVYFNLYRLDEWLNNHFTIEVSDVNGNFMNNDSASVELSSSAATPVTAANLSGSIGFTINGVPTTVTYDVLPRSDYANHYGNPEFRSEEHNV